MWLSASSLRSAMDMTELLGCSGSESNERVAQAWRKVVVIAVVVARPMSNDCWPTTVAEVLWSC